MTYDQWLESVPEKFTKDALWRMEVYRLAVFLADLAWQDVTKLLQDKRTISLADQLFEAVGSLWGPISPKATAGDQGEIRLVFTNTPSVRPENRAAGTGKAASRFRSRSPDTGFRSSPASSVCS